MILLVGLGNPGKTYANTPHNIGFRAIDFFKKKHIPLKNWKERFGGLFVQTHFTGKEFLLFKPLSFMNNSGKVLKEVIGAFPLCWENLWVIHDEFDLPWGMIKVDFNRSSAGHKGIQSIIEALGTKVFWRFRLGVRPKKIPEDMDEYLTGKTLNAQTLTLEKVILKIVNEIIVDSLTASIRKRREVCF